MYSCKCGYADECDGVTATFHPFQVGAGCSTSRCRAIKSGEPSRLTEDQIRRCVFKADADIHQRRLPGPWQTRFVRAVEDELFSMLPNTEAQGR